jgi:hypothetical protein
MAKSVLFSVKIPITKWNYKTSALFRVISAWPPFDAHRLSIGGFYLRFGDKNEIMDFSDPRIVSLLSLF